DHDESSSGPRRPDAAQRTERVRHLRETPGRSVPAHLCHHGPMHRVVIVGAGFGGLSAARTLMGTPAEGTTVEQRNSHTFHPLLYEGPPAGLESGDVAYPIRSIF